MDPVSDSESCFVGEEVGDSDAHHSCSPLARRPKTMAPARKTATEMKKKMRHCSTVCWNRHLRCK